MMTRQHTPSPMLAREAGAPRSSRSRTAKEKGPLLPAKADPDAVVDGILALLAEDRYDTARRMAKEAIARFAAHRRVQSVWRIFDTRAEAIRRPGTKLSRREEFDWLRDPPESLSGQWVALVGKEMVAAADSLPELVKDLRSLNLPKSPLVHRLG